MLASRSVVCNVQDISASNRCNIATTQSRLLTSEACAALSRSHKHQQRPSHIHLRPAPLPILRKLAHNVHTLPKNAQVEMHFRTDCWGPSLLKPLVGVLPEVAVEHAVSPVPQHQLPHLARWLQPQLHRPLKPAAVQGGGTFLCGRRGLCRDQHAALPQRPIGGHQSCRQCCAPNKSFLNPKKQHRAHRSSRVIPEQGPYLRSRSNCRRVASSCSSLDGAAAAELAAVSPIPWAGAAAAGSPALVLPRACPLRCTLKASVTFCIAPCTAGGGEMRQRGELLGMWAS